MSESVTVSDSTPLDLIEIISEKVAFWAHSAFGNPDDPEPARWVAESVIEALSSAGRLVVPWTPEQIAENDGKRTPVERATVWDIGQWIAIYSDMATHFQDRWRETETDHDRRAAEEYYGRRNELVGELKRRTELDEERRAQDQRNREFCEMMDGEQ